MTLQLPNKPVVSMGIIIASLGRPDSLRQALAFINEQTVIPLRIILSVECADDVKGLDAGKGVEIIYGPRGSCHQRNRALDAIGNDCSYIAIFDDDYVPSRYVLEGIVRAFESFPEVAGISGDLIADGINSSGISHQEAVAMVSAAERERGFPTSPQILKKTEGLYGCNMALRSSAIGKERFDEALPLYAWMEDIDFAARLQGLCVRTDAFYGVHRGDKDGREKSGVLLGYSQIANPLYMRQKNTLSRNKAWRTMVRTFLANHGKMFRPEPWIDRKGRAKGNWIAIWHIITFQIRPDYILKLRK
jgi:GT2 family glycosyltransferase